MVSLNRLCLYSVSSQCSVNRRQAPPPHHPGSRPSFADLIRSTNQRVDLDSTANCETYKTRPIRPTHIQLPNPLLQQQPKQASPGPVTTTTAVSGVRTFTAHRLDLSSQQVRCLFPDDPQYLAEITSPVPHCSTSTVVAQHPRPLAATGHCKLAARAPPPPSAHTHTPNGPRSPAPACWQDAAPSRQLFPVIDQLL